MTRHPAPTRVHAIALSLLAALALCAGAGVAAAPALATGDANTASCPNEAMEGFREYLPDCRAYELVSPGFTDGSQVGNGTQISGNGDRVAEESRGGYAGTENNGGETDYLLSRSASGWGVAPLAPPTSQFPAQVFSGFNSSFTESLWIARTPQEANNAENLYIRSENGTMTEIGPLPNPADTSGPPAGEDYGFEFQLNHIIYRAASPDLSHVLFSIVGSGPVWPGDTTQSGAESLYEYPGLAAKAPALVGVSDGHTVVNGATVPAGKLISSCRTVLGSFEFEDLYNALADDGSVSFFTATGKEVGCSGSAPEVNELYARVDGSETVAVSQPSTANCSACKAPDALVKSEREALNQRFGRNEITPEEYEAMFYHEGAKFAGASEDGSKVFFMTPYELLPGAKGENLYEYDFDNAAGQKIVRVSTGAAEPGVLGVARVSEDGSHVYFVAEGVLTGAGADGKAPVAGQPNLYLFERDPAHPGGAVSFVATLAPATEITGTGEHGGDAEDWGSHDSREVQATPDGQYLVFVSRADLVPGDTSATPQVFEYDAADGELVRVSMGKSNYGAGAANADAGEWRITSQGYGGADSSVSPGVADDDLAISKNGSEVVFTGAGSLTAEAEAATREGRKSIYMFDSPPGGRLSEGGVSFVAGSVAAGKAPGDAIDGLTSSGSDLFFNTPESLLAGDENTQTSMYDARVDGGFAARTVAPACAGEACRGSASAAVSPLGAGDSEAVPGAGNLIAPAAPAVTAPAKPKTTPKAKPCKRGYIKRKRRCVERTKTKQAHKGGK